MLSSRVIPCLLLDGNRLVKTVKFQDPVYIGDPINAVNIFNEKEVDELVFLDIGASRPNTEINYKLLAKIASEAFMPMAYGGGVKTLQDVERILKMGFEKVVINSAAFKNRKLLKDSSDRFGSQAIVGSIDVKKNIWGKLECVISGGREKTGARPVNLAKEYAETGVGEIFLNSVDKDGTMSGYDLALIKEISQSVAVPVTVCGGASTLSDFKQAIEVGKASAVAAGSFFVFYGKHKAVLITYPSKESLRELGLYE